MTRTSRWNSGIALALAALFALGCAGEAGPLVANGAEPEDFDPLLTTQQAVVRQGPWRVAVVGFHDPASTQPPVTVAQLDALMTEVAAFFSEVSYGRLAVTVESGAVYGPFTLPASTANVEPAVRAALLEAGLDLSGYDDVVAIGHRANTNLGGTATLRFAWALPESRYVAHEMGHLIGLGHAGFSDCGTSVTGGAGIACTGIEYGDRFSVMGVPKLGHPSVGHKLAMGFLDDAQVPVASAGGTFTVQPLETTGTGLKGIRLPWGSQQLFVEYRKRVGFDANLDASVSTGALFHLDTQLLDLTPTSPRSELNAVLLPGSPPFVVPGVASVAVLSAGTTLRLAVTAVPPLADVTLDGLDGPLTGTAPFSTRLSWSGTGTCTLGGSGPVAVDGFEDLDLQAGTHTFSLSCTNTRGTTTDQVTVTVLEPTQRPTVALTLDGAEAEVVTYTDRTVQAWFSSQFATLGCTRSGAWSGPLALRGEATFAPPSAGTFTFSVRCTNPLGDTVVSRRAVVHAVPQVRLSSPVAGAFVRGQVPAQLSVSDWAAVRGAELFTPNGIIAFVGAQASWDTTTLPDGPVTLMARAQRLDWMSEFAPSVDVTVDNTAPAGSVTAPTSAWVRGAVTVKATGADALSAVRLQLFVDGVALGSEGAGPTRSVSWDTRVLPSGSQHTIAARVTDAAGNQAWTAARTVTVDNVAATMTAPTVSAASATSLVVRWQTNEDARATVQYGLTGLTSTKSASGYRRDHAVILTGLTAGATYHLRAKSVDRAGNVTMAPEVTFRLP